MAPLNALFHAFSAVPCSPRRRRAEGWAHRIPFAGSLRYHPGLVTPNADTCKIFIDGEPYYWKDGEDVRFDEPFIHYAENKGEVTRLILFCDVKQPIGNGVTARLNHLPAKPLVRASKTQSIEGEPVDVLNWIFLT